MGQRNTKFINKVIANSKICAEYSPMFDHAVLEYFLKFAGLKLLSLTH
jgi:hypothetical protein